MSWRDKFDEDNRLLIELFSGWRGKAYLFIAVLTFAHQARYRWEHCEGALSCGLSLFKGIIWGSTWPFFWINYATDFVLFHPYRW